MPAEPNAVAETPGLLVLPLPRQPCSQSAVKLRRPSSPAPPQVLRIDNNATPAQQGGEEITFLEPLFCARHFIYVPRSIPQYPRDENTVPIYR